MLIKSLSGKNSKFDSYAEKAPRNSDLMNAFFALRQSIFNKT